MDHDEKVGLAKRLWDLRGTEGATDVVTDDVVFDFSRSIGPQKGVYEGVDGLRQIQDMYLDAFGTVDVVVTRAIDAGEGGLVVGNEMHAKGKASGIEVVGKGGLLYEFRDGKLARFVLYQSIEEALAAAGLDSDHTEAE